MQIQQTVILLKEVILSNNILNLKFQDLQEVLEEEMVAKVVKVVLEVMIVIVLKNLQVKMPPAPL